MANVLNETSITADAYSNTLHPDDDGCISGTYSYNVGSGNLVAVLKLQCSNELDPDIATYVGWVTEPTHSFPSHPGGTSGTNAFAFSNCKHKAYRIWVDFTSGDGPMKIMDGNG